MEPATKVKNFDKRMTGASVIDDVLKEVIVYLYLQCNISLTILNLSFFEIQLYHMKSDNPKQMFVTFLVFSTT